MCGVGGHARGRVEGREGVYGGARQADGRKMQLRWEREMHRVEELLEAGGQSSTVGMT